MRIKYIRTARPSTHVWSCITTCREPCTQHCVQCHPGIYNAFIPTSSDRKFKKKTRNKDNRTFTTCVHKQNQGNRLPGVTLAEAEPMFEKNSLSHTNLRKSTVIELFTKRRRDGQRLPPPLNLYISVWISSDRRQRAKSTTVLARDVSQRSFFFASETQSPKVWCSSKAHR